MNINAKQVNGIDIHNKMDITTVLGFFTQIKSIIVANTTLATALAAVWTAFLNALDAFDNAYAQTRKWMQTEDLDELDKGRDGSLRGFDNATNALVASPNTEKAAAAKRVKFVRDKYPLNASDEYMKETTGIDQMVQEMETSCMADLTLLGLDEWLADLKAKNEAFLAKMNERTEEQSGMQKGIVRDTRLQAEAAYRDVVKLINAMAICEVPAGLDFNAPIDRLNAEIEHYKQIIARKGGGSGSSSSNQSNQSNQNNQNNSENSENSENSGENNGGDSGDNGGGLPPSGGGETGGDDNGGGDNGGGGLPSDPGGETGGGGLPPSGGEG